MLKDRQHLAVFRACRIARKVAVLIIGNLTLLSAMTSAATVSGTVVDDEGKPLSGTQVVLTSTKVNSKQQPGGDFAPNPPNSNAPRSSTATSSEGYFEFSKVAPGSYSICISPGDRKYVDSCGSVRAQDLEVRPTSTTVETSLKALAGSEVSVLIASKKPGSNLPTHVFLAGPDGSFFAMTEDRGTGRFWAVVPPNKEWRIVTSTVGGAFSPPGEPIRSLAVGDRSNSTIFR